MVKCTKQSTYIKAHTVAYLNGPTILKRKRLFIWCTKQNDLTKFFKLSNCFKGELLIIHTFFRSLKCFFNFPLRKNKEGKEEGNLHFSFP